MIVEFLGDAFAALDERQRDTLSSYVHARITRVLEIGTLLHALADARGEHEYAGRGCATFVRDALAVWADSFQPIAQPWRLAPIFEVVEGGEQRVLADVTTLEVMATNRAFGWLDSRWRLLSPEL